MMYRVVYVCNTGISLYERGLGIVIIVVLFWNIYVVLFFFLWGAKGLFTVIDANWWENPCWYLCHLFPLSLPYY
jgi:hypothetical protein